jgi:hypothetical protein
MGDMEEAYDASISGLWHSKCVITSVEDCSSLFLGTINIKIESSSTAKTQNNETVCDRDTLPTCNDLDKSECLQKSYDCVRDSAGNVCISQGQSLTLDGATGRILNGNVPLMEPAIDRDFTTLLQWTSQYRRVDILGSCDTADEVHNAIQYGAEGIGLLRIEHLYVIINTFIIL